MLAAKTQVKKPAGGIIGILLVNMLLEIKLARVYFTRDGLPLKLNGAIRHYDSVKFIVWHGKLNNGNA